MDNSNRFIWIFSTVFIVVVIGVTGFAFFGPSTSVVIPSIQSVVEEVISDSTSTVEADEPKLDISSIDDAYDAILNLATKSFVGSHPLDESFLGWFVTRYGVDALESIATCAASEDNSAWYEITGSSIHVLWYYYCQDMGYDQEEAQIYTWNCASSYEMTLLFTGDYSLAAGTAICDYYESVDCDLTQCLSSELLDYMNAADILTVNNETTYSVGGTARSGMAYTFQTVPSYAYNLLLMGTDVVNLANNHVYDFGEDGLLQTLATVEELSLPIIGAGENLDEASEPVYFIANGKKIAIVAATQIERSKTYTKEATATTAGVLKTLDSAKYAAVIEAAKANADYVICFVHWGTENTHYFGTDQYKLAQTFVEAGADAIVGCHSHCLQGVDMIDGVPVFYSLGNFYFTQYTELPTEYDTAMAQLTIAADGSLQAKIIPCYFSEGLLTLETDGDKADQIIADISSYSQNATLDSQGNIVSLTAEEESEELAE